MSPAKAWLQILGAISGLRYLSGCDEHVAWLTEYAAHTLEAKQVSVIVRSIDGLSPLAQSIIARFVRVLPSLAVHLEELTSGVESQGENRRVEEMRRWIKRRSERGSLKILLVETRADSSAVHEELERSVELFLKISGKSTRGKWIVFLLNGRSSASLRDFFEWAWKHKFLDLSVYETEIDEKRRSYFPICNKSRTFLHHYNPYYDAYYKVNFEKGIDVFPDKLRQMNGVSLFTSLFQDIPLVMIKANYSGDNVWDMVQGLDVTVTIALAEALNFSAVLRLVNSENEAFRRFNLTTGDVEEAIENEVVEFSVNHFGIIGSIPLEDLRFEPCGFLLPISNHLIIKQYGRYVVTVSFQSIFALVTVALSILVIFFTSSRVFRLDKSFWTAINIFKILIGNFINYRRRLEIYEKILILCLIIVSSIFSVQIMERMMNACLYGEKFTDFNSLQSLLDSGIVASIKRDSKEYLSLHSEYETLQTLLRRSTTIEDEDSVSECVNNLVRGSLEKPVNGCEVNAIFGKLIEQSYSRESNGWVISMVQEPLQPAWTAMAVTKTSPISERFSGTLQRFCEAGLMIYWMGATMRNYTGNYKELYSPYDSLRRVNDDPLKIRYFSNKKKIPLFGKLMVFILITGHLLSFFVFFGEIAWNRLYFCPIYLV